MLAPIRLPLGRTPRALCAGTLAVGIAVFASACGSGGYVTGGDANNGKQLFSQKCGSCHALADAGTTSTIGPDLDQAFKYDRDQGIKESSIRQIVAGQVRAPNSDPPTCADSAEVTDGCAASPGMPANLVRGQDVKDVAAYVASVAGKPVQGGGGGGGGAITGTDGKTIFQNAGCATCHTLADAGASGAVGPNLDDAKPAKALVVDRVTNGKGVMPSFKGKLTAAQIQAVADYVSSSAGK